MTWYILDGDTPVPVKDPGGFLDSKARIVGQTTVGVYFVSTVFLCLNHNHSGEGPPVLWETMVFDYGADGEEIFCERYSSAEDARQGHFAAVAYARELKEIEDGSA